MQGPPLAMYMLSQLLMQNSPPLGGLGTITAAVQMGAGWGGFVLGAGVMTRAGAPRRAPLSHTATPGESGNREKERELKTTPLTAHILR